MDGCKGWRRPKSVVQWSGKNEFWSVKSQGISFQTKSGHPVKNWIIKKISQYIGLG